MLLNRLHIDDWVLACVSLVSSLRSVSAAGLSSPWSFSQYLEFVLHLSLLSAFS